MQKFKPTYLYIKEHNKTKLKYFGKTNKKDPHKYRGSGIYWTRHLEIHGNDVTTTIYGYYTTREELIKDALEFSSKHNIVNSDEWANLRKENGLLGGDTSGCFTNESRKKISQSSSGVNNQQAKLTKEQVIEIYYSCELPEILSKKFQVGTGQIFGIKRKIYYSNITQGILELPGYSTAKKKVRIPIPIDIIKKIYLEQGTYDYFMETYRATYNVVRNIKSKKSYKKITSNLGDPGQVKRYKLSNQDTVDIFHSNSSLKDLALKYNVNIETIRNIKNGTTRKYFSDDF